MTATRVLRAGSLSLLVRPRTAAVAAALAALTLLAAVAALATGDLHLGPGRVLAALVGHGDARDVVVVTGLRLPRVLTGAAVGAALALSGAVFQSLSRNPLGSPEIVGFTTGCATGALVVLVAAPTAPFGLAAGALGGGALTALAVLLLSWRRGRRPAGHRLLLVGIGVSALLQAVNAYLLTRAGLLHAQAAQTWLFGSLHARGWEHVRPAALGLLVCGAALAALAPGLRRLELGDDAAAALGTHVPRTRLGLLAVATALCAVAVAAAGPISFVALAAPQVARRLTRGPGIPLTTSALVGALLLVAADVAAQRALAPVQLPVGVATLTAGGAYLVWLLRRA